MKNRLFAYAKNIGANQLRDYHTVDQRLWFRYIDSTFFSFLDPKFKPLSISIGCTARFVSDMVGNAEDMFSHDAARLIPLF